MSNPYSPPDNESLASASDESRRPRNASVFRVLWGIVAAVMFDMCLSMALVLLLGVVLGLVVAAIYRDLQAFERLVSSGTTAVVLTFCSGVLGAGASFMAGKLCRNMTRGDTVALPVIAGLIAATLATAWKVLSVEEPLSPGRVFNWTMTVIAYWLGGWRSLKLRERRWHKNLLAEDRLREHFTPSGDS